jgi:hypothetical protein
MYKRTGIHALALSLLLVAAPLAPPALAQGVSIASVKAEFDAIEKRVPSVKKGDAKLANELINLLNTAKAHLNASDKADPQWPVLAKRSSDLDAWIRAQALGKPKPDTEAPDEYTAKAQTDLEVIAKDIEKVDTSDVPAANAIVARINATRDLLSKSPNRAQKTWKDAVARADALDKRLRERFAQAAAAPKAAPAAGASPASTAAAVKPLPEDSAKGLDMNDKYVFTSEFEPVYRDYANQLNKSDPTVWADDWNASKVTDAIARMRKALQKIANQGHAGVKGAVALLNDLEAAFKARQAEGKRLVAARAAAAQAEASEVGARLDELSAFFNSETFSAELKEPFSAQKVRDWVKEVKGYEALGKKGLASLDLLVKEHPDIAEDARVKSLRYWFGTSMPKRLKRDVDMSTEWYKDGSQTTQGRMLFRVESAQALLKPGVITEKLLTDQQWVASRTATAEQGLQAAEGLVAFYKDYYGQDDEVYIKAAADLRGLADRIQAGAGSALRDTRMPEAKSKDQELLRVATEVVKRVGAGPYERMVVSYDLHHFTEEKREARADGDYIKIWKWTEEWDEYAVTLAEKGAGVPTTAKAGGANVAVGANPEDYYLVQYLITKIIRGPSWKTVGSWYCSERIVSRKILKENIAK